jgi:glycosyltransferase involved in cell wall biosynthesis
MKEAVMPLISVIIPTRNRATMVPTAVESVFAARSATIEVEVIVVDDGSIDNTPDVIQSYPVHYLRINGGSAAHARSAGMEIARGDFITFLDDDDAWAPNNPVAQMALFEQHPEYGAVCARMMLADEELKPVAGPFPEQPPESGWLFNHFLGYVPATGTMIVRSSISQAVGGFDLSLHAAEDWDWALRVAKACQIGFVDDIAVVCRQHAQSRDHTHLGEARYQWLRFMDTQTVYHKHIKGLPLAVIVKSLRHHWSHRGWFVPEFMRQAQEQAKKRNLRGMLYCLQFALRASPLHVASFLIRTR